MIDHPGTCTIKTKRLILRAFTAEDVSAMYKNWASDPQVTRYLTWSAHEDEATTRQVITYWISQYDNPQYYQWAIVDKETLEAIGSISLVKVNNAHHWGEVGYCLSRAYWGRGMMTEALLAVEGALFSRGFHRLSARHRGENPASGRVMVKAGMKYEGLERECYLNSEGTYSDLYYYGILSSEYKKRQAQKPPAKEK